MDPWHYCNNHHAFSWGCIMRRSDHYSRDLCETHPGSDRVIKYKASNRPLLTLCWEHSAGQYHCHSQIQERTVLFLVTRWLQHVKSLKQLIAVLYAWALGYIIIPYLTWLSDRKKFISIRHWTSRNLFSDFTWLSWYYLRIYVAEQVIFVNIISPTNYEKQTENFKMWNHCHVILQLSMADAICMQGVNRILFNKALVASMERTQDISPKYLLLISGVVIWEVMKSSISYMAGYFLSIWLSFMRKCVCMNEHFFAFSFSPAASNLCRTLWRLSRSSCTVRPTTKMPSRYTRYLLRVRPDRTVSICL